MSLIIEEAPKRLKIEYERIFTKDSLNFLEELVNEFDVRVERILLDRERRKLDIADGKWMVKFENESHMKTWTVCDIPMKLKTRKLDLGDVSPANTANFIDALYCDVQGIQVDFDDGHCPTWRNTIQGIYNVTMAVRSQLAGGPMDIRQAPILMLRPRAFNMIEHHCMVNGKEVSAPLFDFALLMFLNGCEMAKLNIGPYFYLSKIENVAETKLWNDIFVWTQTKLAIKLGTIRVCVLIENILAAYCMEDILYSIRDHAIGLNCGIWDYSASIIAKFGNNRQFLLPDRNKYVNMTKHFLSSYMRLLINVCHRRGALATGGMAAQLLPAGKGTCSKSMEIIELVKMAKRREIAAGIDGFMVYDMRIVPHLNELWQMICGDRPNQMHQVPNVDDINAKTLIEIPKGGVTMEGLRHNIAVAILFIYHWLSGNGVFYYNGAVEDSATAEISRSQLWQWIRFSPIIENTTIQTTVTHYLIYKLLMEIIAELKKTYRLGSSDYKRLLSSKYILLEIITSRVYIEYITTFLNDNHKFRALHNKVEGLEAKL